jgi:predicted small metal-binding protein
LLIFPMIHICPECSLEISADTEEALKEKIVEHRKKFHNASSFERLKRFFFREKEINDMERMI